MLPLQQAQLQHSNQQQQIPAPPPPQPLSNPQDLSLAGVLHFLQTEWRRYERERNEWEIERAEMRARIALLEGERRSFENIKIDLLRRVKMMEYALRVERTKQLQQSTTTAPAAKSTGSHSVKDEPGGAKDGSGSNSPHSDDVPLPNDARLSIASLPAIANGAQSQNTKVQPWKENWAGSSGAGANLALGKPPPGRDPRARTRSRDYLKQCLLEVSYLTSPSAMNPLPNRPLVNGGALPLTLPNLPSFEGNALNGRPRKVVPDINNKEFPLVNGNQQQIGERADKQQPSIESSRHADTSLSHLLTNSQDEEPTQLTAIFRPDDAGAWRERLRAAHEEAAMRQGLSTGSSGLSNQTLSGSGWDLGQDDGVAEDADDDTEAALMEEDGSKKWRVRRTLRNHLDSVRAIAFHPKDMILATGGDDLTLKVWRMDANQLASNNVGRMVELEPQVTLRGHAAPITSIAIAPHRGLVYSASLDATIRVWAIPNIHHTTYSPYESTTSRGILVGHSDAVWDLTLLREGSMLVSCGADGVVKVWEVGTTAASPGNLRLSWGYNGNGATELAASTSAAGSEEPIGATVVEGIKTNLRVVAVAYRNSVIKLFDVETGKDIGQLQIDGPEGATNTQVNTMVSHPTMDWLVAGYEDKYIRLFDLSSKQCTHAMIAHLDAVTSLSIDPSGFSLVSGSHDCSIRFWDLMNSRSCLQEDTKHRQKAEEGVLAVSYHPSLPFMASAGADGVIKIWASS